jgi:peptidylprolyl isomerase
VTVDYLGLNYVTCAEFDSSWSRDTVTTFALDSVIPGFTKGIAGTAAVAGKAATASASAIASSPAIAGMKVGGRREIIVPPGDGYGTAGSPPNITGNEELIFVVDVLAASKTPATGSAAATAATTPAATTASAPATSTTPSPTPAASAS